MTREERRKAMPTVTQFIDQWREDFPKLEVRYAAENGHSWGERGLDGVTPILEAKEK